MNPGHLVQSRTVLYPRVDLKCMIYKHMYTSVYDYSVVPYGCEYDDNNPVQCMQGPIFRLSCVVVSFAFCFVFVRAWACACASAGG